MLTPIVFNFNDDFVVPAGVCITSLLENADSSTHYQIIILHSGDRLSISNRNVISDIVGKWEQHSVQFVDVGDIFKNEYEIRGITIDAYYRLAISEFVKDYDKVLYCDCDVIVLDDLSHLMSLDLSEYFLAGVPVRSFSKKYIHSIGIEGDLYFNSGFLVMNLAKMRGEDSFNAKILPLLGQEFRSQDQDILNIAYGSKTLKLDYRYNFSINKIKDVPDFSNPKVIHYVGLKPWQELRPLGELWWEYYRKTPFSDIRHYIAWTIESFDSYTRDRQLGKVFQRLKLNKFEPMIKKIWGLFRRKGKIIV